MDITVAARGGSLINNYDTTFYQVVLSYDSSHYVYGYGYGYYSDVSSPVLDYFNVLDVYGESEGYGVLGTETGDVAIATMEYGWGYEQSGTLSGDSSEEMIICATVLENGGVPSSPENIPVLFTGGPGIIFSKNLVYTDYQGKAYVTISINSSVQRNQDIQGGDPKYSSIPDYGFMFVEATIWRKSQFYNGNISVATILEQRFTDSEYDSTTVASIGYGYDYTII